MLNSLFMHLLLNVTYELGLSFNFKKVPSLPIADLHKSINFSGVPHEYPSLVVKALAKYKPFP